MTFATKMMMKKIPEIPGNALNSCFALRFLMLLLLHQNVVCRNMNSRLPYVFLLLLCVRIEALAQLFRVSDVEALTTMMDKSYGEGDGIFQRVMRAWTRVREG